MNYFKILFNKLTNKSHKAKIEFISLGKITGWIFDEKTNFLNLQLIVGNKIVTETRIDKERPDVCNKYKIKGHTGFELDLPPDIGLINKSTKISLIAVSSDGKKIIEFLDKKDRDKVYSEIKNILINYKSLLGLVGNFDGIQSDGLMHGWASWKNSERIANVWLQSEGLKPLKIECDNFRKEMQEKKYFKYCGFSLDPGQLNQIYSKKKIYFTFDKAGKFKLPQSHETILPEIKFIENKMLEKLLFKIDRSLKNIINDDYYKKYKYLGKKYSEQEINDIFRLCLIKPYPKSWAPSTQVLLLMLQAAVSDNFNSYPDKFERIGNYILRKMPSELKPIVYSFGIGNDISFDLAIVSKFKVPVYMYDPTPNVVNFMAKYSDNKNLIFKQEGIFDKETELKLYHHNNPKKLNSSIYQIGQDEKNFSRVKCKTLDMFVKENKHKNIDILKMDVEGVADKVLRHMLKYTEIRPKQIVTEFEIVNIESAITYIPKLVDTFELLKLNGYKIFNQLLTRKPTIELIFIDKSLQWKEKCSN